MSSDLLQGAAFAALDGLRPGLLYGLSAVSASLFRLALVLHLERQEGQGEAPVPLPLLSMAVTTALPLLLALLAAPAFRSLPLAALAALAVAAVWLLLLSLPRLPGRMPLLRAYAREGDRRHAGRREGLALLLSLPGLVLAAALLASLPREEWVVHLLVGTALGAATDPLLARVPPLALCLGPLASLLALIPGLSTARAAALLALLWLVCDCRGRAFGARGDGA